MCKCGSVDCEECEKRDERAKARSKRARDNRKAKDYALESMGLTKVKGAMGGTYWE